MLLLMILLTRPYKNSLELAEKLGAENCIIEPMLEIRQLDYNIKNNYQAVVKTSKNITLPYQGECISIPKHGKNAQEILQYCLKKLQPESGKVLYLSGNNISLDIAEELRKNGFDAERIIAYEQIPATEFSDEFLKKFKNSHRDWLRTRENQLI